METKKSSLDSWSSQWLNISNLCLSLIYTIGRCVLISFQDVVVVLSPSFVQNRELFWIIGLYLSLDSFAPKSRKINFIKTSTHHVMMICPECKLDDELKKITDIFLTNSYHESVILSNIKFIISKFHSSETFDLQKCPVYIKIPWIRSSSQFFADKISLCNALF